MPRERSRSNSQEMSNKKKIALKVQRLGITGETERQQVDFTAIS
jgi:hypothetical protein